MFVVAMVYFYSATYSSKVAQNYESTLSPELRSHYKGIVAERSRLAYEGYGLGLILAVAFVWLQRGFAGRIFKREKLSSLSMVCIVVSVMFVTNYFYYMLSPKKQYMLNYLKDQNEISNWLKMYREMQFNYHTGLLCGVVAAGIAAFAFRC